MRLHLFAWRIWIYLAPAVSACLLDVLMSLYLQWLIYADKVFLHFVAAGLSYLDFWITCFLGSEKWPSSHPGFNLELRISAHEKPLFVSKVPCCINWWCSFLKAIVPLQRKLCNFSSPILIWVIFADKKRHFWIMNAVSGSEGGGIERGLDGLMINGSARKWDSSAEF